MGDPKSRIYKAKCRAAQILESGGYRVANLSDEIFDIEAVRASEMRKIKICIDEVTDRDRSGVHSVIFPPFCTKEIWLKQAGNASFLIIEIKTCQ